MDIVFGRAGKRGHYACFYVVTSVLIGVVKRVCRFGERLGKLLDGAIIAAFPHFLNISQLNIKVVLVKAVIDVEL